MKRSERIPLLKDYHSHPYLYAALAHCPDLSAITSKAEAMERILRTVSEEELAVVVGWNDSHFDFDREELNKLPPLVVFNLSLHSLLINSAAREILSSHFPELVRNVRNSEWIERNSAFVINFLISMKPCSAMGLRSYFDDLAKLGVWYAEEMSLKDEREIELFRAAGLLNRTSFWTDPQTFESLSAASAEHIHGIKIWLDGALGARSASLGRPYRCGAEGVLVYGDEELYRIATHAFEGGKSLAAHAIGDRALEQIVRVLSRVAGGRQEMQEARIEHCQFITTELAHQAKELGITLSMQPNFSSDSICYRDRLPAGYPERNNPFRMLLDEVGFVAGKDLLFGSDGMPHGIVPALQNALFPMFPGQRLDLEELISGYCMPDCSNGYVDITIDYDNKSIECQIFIKKIAA